MSQTDAYSLVLSLIERGEFQPGDRLVESELAERLGVSRTPIREVLQRLETQGMLRRDGRSLVVASLSHDELGELYTVRSELEGLAARLAARHAAPEEMRVLQQLVDEDRARVDDPMALAQSNRRFHHQIHLASHNRFLIRQLEMIRRSMALMSSTSLSAEGRGAAALAEHQRIVDAITARDEDGAASAIRKHLSTAFETRLRLGTEP
ncbi:GntR family transcriptional regulator [Paracoccaceae bacterium GXU_MW_L88]